MKNKKNMIVKCYKAIKRLDTTTKLLLGLVVLASTILLQVVIEKRTDVKKYQNTPVVAVNDTLTFIGDDTLISSNMRDTLIFFGDDTDDTFVDSSSAQPRSFFPFFIPTKCLFIAAFSVAGVWAFIIIFFRWREGNH
jgi:hypothetical protein